MKHTIFIMPHLPGLDKPGTWTIRLVMPRLDYDEHGLGAICLETTIERPTLEEAEACCKLIAEHLKEVEYEPYHGGI